MFSFMSTELYENHVKLHEIFSWTEVPQSIRCTKPKIYFKIKLKVQQIALKCKGSYLENWQLLADKIFLIFYMKSEN